MLQILLQSSVCQLVVRDCLAGKIGITAVPNNLRALGISPEVAQDYIDQIIQRIRAKQFNLRTSEVQNLLLRALMKKIGKNYIASEVNSSKMLISIVIGKFVMQVKLLPGLCYGISKRYSLTESDT